MERYVCIHGHFYQPPRENPWLEASNCRTPPIPIHDWNERITAECYAPNASSRILDRGRPDREDRQQLRPDQLQLRPDAAVLDGGEEPRGLPRRSSRPTRKAARRSPATAPPWRRATTTSSSPWPTPGTSETQVLWGIADFERRFGRTPEGMWLPETAVDLETLEILAEQGIRFTILAPHQAGPGAGEGQPRLEGRQRRPDRSDDALSSAVFRRGEDLLFFYDGPISRAVAFEGLLDNGELFADRLLGAFSDQRPWPQQLVHIATDGETYGHHHRHGEMALRMRCAFIDANPGSALTNYGEFLEKFPPTHEVQIIENSSWSCVHGVERWRSNCGCNSGGHRGGTRSGGHRCGRRWTGFGTHRPPVRRGREAALRRIRGRPGTSISR